MQLYQPSVTNLDAWGLARELAIIDVGFHPNGLYGFSTSFYANAPKFLGPKEGGLGVGWGGEGWISKLGHCQTQIHITLQKQKKRKNKKRKTSFKFQEDILHANSNSRSNFTLAHLQFGESWWKCMERGFLLMGKFIREGGWI